MAIRDPSSFRDPSGFVFRQDGVLYRLVTHRYVAQFDRLVESGLLDRLTAAGLLVRFERAASGLSGLAEEALLIRPIEIPTVSYPYEWCFEQLRDAALVTLEIQRICLEAGFTLKDASAYNVQFHHGAPVFIDTLSFEDLREGEPWRAYRQFCQHFLAPLSIASYVDPRLISLTRIHMDGIPLDLATALLPIRAKLNSGLGVHLYLHAKSNSREQPTSATPKPISRQALLALTDSLKRTIEGLKAPNGETEWSDYYSETNYSPVAGSSKRAIVAEFFDCIGESKGVCWDLGANNGEFSRIALDRGWDTVAWDLDHGAVSSAYAWAKRHRPVDLLPLIQDLANPSPSIGWGLSERRSLIDRGPAHVALMLALVHHLAIGNNVPLASIADFVRGIARWLIVEFVPKEDSQAQRMLRAREDIFDGYNQAEFETEFSMRYKIERRVPVADSVRTLYLMRGID